MHFLSGSDYIFIPYGKIRNVAIHCVTNILSLRDIPQLIRISESGSR